MEQKDIDFIKRFEENKRKGLRMIVILFLIALMCCSVYILWDVLENGTVEVTLPYFMKKFSFGFFIGFLIYLVSYNEMRRKYKKLKKKESL